MRCIKMKKANILEAINRLNSALSKVKDFDVSTVDLSDRVLDNRIITLEGYLRFLENEGIPKIRSIYEKINNNMVVTEGGLND
ncbi:hypothetical protein Hore_12370 [Halothermothrix orenii H 168]|uniref:Uncharacterized protein n=2 Tax=Halothermothrix orenii TaxID=31909 RepID=B8CXG8_HALOH|nr:hypothetical protein Hore_12370 [Halothermothrix orenii H 168]